MQLTSETMIVGHPDTLKHPMWTKMWQRAGIDPARAASQFIPMWSADWRTSASIITLGEPALRAVTGRKELFRWRGRQIHSAPGQFVYPTMAPDQLLPFIASTDEDEDDDDGLGLSHKPARFQGVWVHDVHHALQQHTRLKPEPPSTNYFVDPPLSQWNHIVSYMLSGHRLSFDIETAYKMSKMDDEEWEAQGLIDGQILRISFCHTPGYSVSVPWTQMYMPGILALLGSAMPKIGWNAALFDVPRLRAENAPVNGLVYDYQDAWHMIQSDLPKGLEWVTSFYTSFHPWKHLNNVNPGLYSCIDADAALQNAMGIDANLDQLGMTQLFHDHVVELMPTLEHAGHRGNAIDLQYSADLEAEMLIHRDQLIKDMQPMYPPVLLPRKRYKTEPVGMEDYRVFEPITVIKDIKVCSHCGQPASSWADHMKGRAKPTKKDPDIYNRCKAAGATSILKPSPVIEWDEILPFNPNSSDQIKAYIAHFKHPMGKNRQTDNASADSKHLEKLSKKYANSHPIYAQIIEFKKVAKTISTYVYRNYLRSDGLIHSTYKNGPSTWRLAAENVNLTNVGKRESNKWTKRARRQIVARPGHVFVGADSTSIEAVVVGKLIGDDDFIRMAGKSIHAWLCCQELGWDFTNETMERVKSEHKDLYNKMKTAIYLLLYGGDPYLMHMTNPENFPTKQSAQEIQDKIYALIPKLKQWQDRQRERAKKECYLTSPWGYRHYFYDVYTFKKDKKGNIVYDDHGKPVIKLGRDSKRCLAFEPQNCAAAFGRDTLVLIGRSKWGQYLSANCFVHDGYTLEVPIDLANEAEQFLVDILTRPVPQLGGLRIGCETEMGYNWAEVDPHTKFWVDGNPNGMRTLRKVECDNS